MLRTASQFCDQCSASLPWVGAKRNVSKIQVVLSGLKQLELRFFRVLYYNFMSSELAFLKSFRSIHCKQCKSMKSIFLLCKET